MNPAIQHGHFELSSGRHTDTYVQTAAYLDSPKKMEQLGKALAQEWYGPVDLVASPAVGGIITGYEVAKQLSVPFVFTERVEGVMTLRRGFTIPPTSKVLIVEDVVTTGQSASEVANVILESGASDVGLMCLTKRYETVPGFDKVFSLFTASAPVWESSACPLCAKDVPLDTPGSRNLG